MTSIRRCFLLLLGWVLLLSDRPFAADSKILNKAAQYMPNLTEVGFITNLVNLYVQLSQYVRSTNHLVSNINSAKQQWERTGDLLGELYEDVQALKNVDLYDMDSWATTLENANSVILLDIQNVRQSFDMFEYYTLDAGMEYLDAISDANSYDYRTRKNRSVVESNFFTEEYKTSLEQFRLVASGYEINTLTRFRARVQEEQARLANAETPEEAQAIALRIENLNSSIVDIEGRIRETRGGATKIDSIMELSSDLIAVNLTEIQYTSQRLKGFEAAAAALRESYQRLVNGEVAAQPKTRTTSAREVPFDLNQYSATDPNNVKVPDAPERETAKTSRVKAVSEQDIGALQNQIDFLALVQESLFRDIQLMKTNTMAFVVALEAYKQDRDTQKAFIAAHSAKMMELSVRDR